MAFAVRPLQPTDSLEALTALRLWRDARILAIGGGATEVMLDEAAKRY